MKIAIATPSRGLVHSRTVSAVMANVETASRAGHELAGWFLSHDLKIPVSHERCVEMALDTNADAVWIVEEDNVPHPDTLLALIDLHAPVAVMDYPIGDVPTFNCNAHVGDDVFSVGLGCALIAREVFERLERPWFSTTGSWGTIDTEFSARLRLAGIPIVEAAGLCGHAVLRNLGKPSSNDGAHRIDVRGSVERWH